MLGDGRQKILAITIVVSTFCIGLTVLCHDRHLGTDSAAAL
jgi:hypothetical protein